MAPLTSYIENTLGTIFYYVRGHEDKLFLRTCQATKDIPAKIVITSDELGGASPGVFTAGKHDLLGENLFPSLKWSAPAELLENIKSWLLIVEDADAPLPSPVVHGIYYGMPATQTKLSNDAFTADDNGNLQGAFKYGANRRGTIWTGPRPVLGHGPHRYFFQLLGLKTNEIWVSDSMLSREDLAGDSSPLKGQVVCVGEYMATFERKL